MTVAMSGEPTGETYPVRLSMEYPERLSRLSTFFRIVLVIPVLIFLALVSGQGFETGSDPENVGAGLATIGGTVVAAIWATILVKGRIPHWLFDFQVGLQRFTNRAYAYVLLLTDKYPAFEGDWLLQYEVDYSDRLSRWKLVIWKFISSIPHLIVLTFLFLAVVAVTIIAWFAILITGAYPRGLHTFVVGVMRWSARVAAYAISLTDAFPPYSLDEDAPPASRSAEVVSGVIGLVIAGVAAVGLTIAVIFLALYLIESEKESVALTAVLAGDVPAAVSSIEMDDVTFTLRRVEDPSEVGFIVPRAGERLVAFAVDYGGQPTGFDFGDGGAQPDITARTLRLQTSEGVERAVLLTLDGVPAPIELDGPVDGELVAIFEVDDGAELEELRAYPRPSSSRYVAWEFE
jgi:hypothetical protein